MSGLSKALAHEIGRIGLHLALASVAVGVLLSIVIINLPEEAAAPPSIECVEWREHRQEYKDLGDVGGFETCVRYGESNEQR